MINLFIDTSHKKTLISVIRDNSVIGTVSEPSENNVSEALFLLVEKVLLEAKIKINDIKKIFVSVGPGSFTSIRIGVTFAKTLAWALKIPVIPVSSLEILATTKTDCDYIVSYIDAGHNHVYAGIYKKNLDVYMEDEYISINDLEKKIPEENVVCISFENVLEKYNHVNPDVNIMKIIDKYKENSGVNPHELKPNYLKKSSAEEKK